MSILSDAHRRGQMMTRLKRAEGQLRGVQRMLDTGQPAGDVANQLVAVRGALDSTYVHFTVSLMEQQFGERVDGDTRSRKLTREALGELTSLLANVR